MGAERGPDGRFLKGHVGCSPGKPVGAVNKITRSLRTKVLDGFGNEDGVTQFVRELKRNCPAAAAGLLARMIPPGGPGDDTIAGPVTITVISIPVGAYLIGDPPRLVSEGEAQRLFNKKPTPLIAPPVVEPIVTDGVGAEIIEIDESNTQPIGDAGVTLSREVAMSEVETGDGGVLVVRSAGLQRRRT